LCHYRRSSVPRAAPFRGSLHFGALRTIRHHYGGPLALYRLAQFTRIQVLKDDPPPRKVLPIPTNVVYQQGNLILRNVDEIPPGAVPVDVEPLPDGRIPLGDGHFLVPKDKE